MTYLVPSAQPKDAAFEFWRGAGQITAGVVEVVAGAALIGGGGAATGGGIAGAAPTGGASLLLSAAGVSAVTTGWVAVGQGATGVLAGAATIADSLSLSTGSGSRTSGTQETRFPTRGMGGRTLSPQEKVQFDAFGERAARAGLQPSPYRTGSWGKIDSSGKYHEVTRIDVAEAGQPGWRGQTHMHVEGMDGHLPLTTKIPGEP